MVNFNALTSGGTIAQFSSGGADVNTRTLVEMENLSTASVGTTVLGVRQVADSRAAFINQDGDGESIVLDSEATSADVFSVPTPATTTGDVLSVTAADSMLTIRDRRRDSV